MGASAAAAVPRVAEGKAAAVTSAARRATGAHPRSRAKIRASRAGSRPRASNGPEMSLTQRLVLALVLVLAVPLPASAQDAAPEQAHELLRRAQQAYFRMRMEEAQQLII